MAVPSLWPWAACLLAILLSLGFGLDTLEGESPPRPPHCLPELHLHHPQPAWGPKTELPQNTAI